MKPVFILSPPRCRTSWLSAYLTGAGVFCFHEAWKQVADAHALRRLMESKGPGTVVNADCANWLFLDEIEREFPEARYVEIHRHGDLEQAWATAFGEMDWSLLMARYQCARQAQHGPLLMSIDFHRWTPEISLQLWDRMTDGTPMDMDWHAQCHGWRIEPTRDQVSRDAEAGRTGPHRDRVMKGASAWDG